MGRYLTRTEWKFIEQAFSRFGWPNLVLDIGGGDGRFARRLTRRGVKVVLLEFASLPLSELKAEETELSLVQGDGNHLPFEAGSIDAVIAIEVLACVDRYHNDNFFRDVSINLKRNGLFLFTTDNLLSVPGISTLWRPCTYRYREYESYTESFFATKKKLSSAGFDIVMTRGFRWLPFSRASESPLVPYASGLERLLGLERIPWLSPWVFWLTRKQKKPDRRS
jgi:SAM-dependent methyltransferase